MNLTSPHNFVFDSCSCFFTGKKIIGKIMEPQRPPPTAAIEDDKDKEAALRLLQEQEEQEEQQLLKKSFQVVVHLETPANLPSYPKTRPHHHHLLKSTFTTSASNSSSEEEIDGRPACNLWKGQNFGLHMPLGEFKSEFHRRLRMYQIPEKVPLSMDPFCRVECSYPPEDPLVEDAFVLWEREGFREDLKCKVSEKPSEVDLLDESRRPGGDGNDGEEEESSFQEEQDFLDNSDSEAEEEILEYIRKQEEKRVSGENVTGEVLVYDEEADVVKNLHVCSISLTSYGRGDEKIFGRKECLFDELDEEEKKCLRAVLPPIEEESEKEGGTQKKECECKIKIERRNRKTGSGDSLKE